MVSLTLVQHSRQYCGYCRATLSLEGQETCSGEMSNTQNLLLEALNGRANLRDLDEYGDLSKDIMRIWN